MPDWVPAVYRSRADGGVLALCRDDWRIDGGGFRVEEGGERTFLEWDGSLLTGTPIDPASGRALPGVRRTIDLEVYEPVLTPHEWVPSVHIPGGGGMTAELAGASLREAAAFFISEFALDMTPEQVIARIENLAAEEYRLRIPLKPGVLEVLDGLDARHIPYCIATATYDSLVEAALERLGIRHRFRFVLTCSQVGSTKATSIGIRFVSVQSNKIQEIVMRQRSKASALRSPLEK